MNDTKKVQTDSVAIITTKVEVNCPYCNFVFDVFDVDLELFDYILELHDKQSYGGISQYEIGKQNLQVTCPKCGENISILDIK